LNASLEDLSAGSVLIYPLDRHGCAFVVCCYAMRTQTALSILTIQCVAFAGKVYAPLPNEVYSAKTIAIVNHTGRQAVADRAFEELQKWGRFTVVPDVAQADVVMVVSVGSISTGATGHISGDDVYVTENRAYLVTTAFFLRTQQEPFFSETKRVALFRRSAAKRCIDDFRKRLGEAAGAAPLIDPPCIPCRHFAV
jgi:hypothetical protein